MFLTSPESSSYELDNLQTVKINFVVFQLFFFYRSNRSPSTPLNKLLSKNMTGVKEHTDNQFTTYFVCHVPICFFLWKKGNINNNEKQST